MTTPDVARCRLVAEIWIWRQGWGWVLACALAAACVMVWTLVLWPQRAETAQWAQRDAVRLEMPTAPVQVAGASAQDTAWQELRAALPSEDRADRLIARALLLAREQGIAIEQADYQYQQDADMKWVQLDMTLPIQGDYPKARRFFEALLREHPNLTMNAIAVKRDSVAAAQPNATLSFSAWFLPANPRADK